MTPAEFRTEFWSAITQLFLPVTAVIAFLGSLFALAVRFTVRPRVQGYVVFLLAFGFLGGVTGLIAGVSREPIVGALLTGLLGIISALLSYLFSKESLKEWRPYIPYSIMLLVVSSLAGISIGGIYKKQWEQFDREYKQWLLEYEKVYLEVRKEEHLLQLRAGAKKEAEASAKSDTKGTGLPTGQSASPVQ